MMEMEFSSIAKIMQVMQETVFGVRIVKSFNLEGTMRQQMHQAVADVSSAPTASRRSRRPPARSWRRWPGIAIAGVILLSGYLVVERGQTPGEIMSFITALLLAYEPAKRLARTRVSLETGMVGVRMMYEITDRPLKLAETPDAKPLQPGPGQITLRERDLLLSRRRAGAAATSTWSSRPAR